MAALGTDPKPRRIGCLSLGQKRNRSMRQGVRDVDSFQEQSGKPPREFTGKGSAHDARVWRFSIRPGKLEEFSEAVRTLVPEARKERGFRGFLVLRGNRDQPNPECTMIGLWRSRSHLPESDQGLFLPRALAHLITCCTGFPLIQERQVLVDGFTTHAGDELIRC
jgi:quinol monooxygenase YgiN